MKDRMVVVSVLVVVKVIVRETLGGTTVLVDVLVKVI